MCENTLNTMPVVRTCVLASFYLYSLIQWKQKQCFSLKTKIQVM